MNPQLLYTWLAEIQRQLPLLGKWQALGLALLSIGVIQARHSSLTRIAEELAGWGQIDSLNKRFKRWIANESIDVLLCCEAWVSWEWRQCDMPQPLLLVDETKLGNRIGVLMVSLAFQQRAIPLLWRCYRANSAQDYPQQGQVLLVWQLLARVQNALPADCRPLVQMDRGIAQSGAMLRALDNLGMRYLVRLKGYTRFSRREGRPQLLRNRLKPGECFKAHGWIFKHEKRVKVWVYGVWEVGQAEAWYLASNDGTLTSALYARRMWQEESFRDLKSGGWQWECSHIRCPQRMERFILVLALAYAWMLTLGTMVLHEAVPALNISKDVKQRYSIFRLGLRYFKQHIAHAPQHLWVGLFFAPPPLLLVT